MRDAGPLQQQGALREHQLDVDAGLDLDRRVMDPRAVRVRPALDAERPVAGARRHHAGLEAVQAGCDVDHAGTRAVHAGRVGEHGRRGDGVVALAEDRGPDRDRFTDDGLGGEPAGLGHGGDIDDGDTSDGGAQGHGANRHAPEPIRRCRPRASGAPHR